MRAAGVTRVGFGGWLSGRWLVAWIRGWRVDEVVGNGVSYLMDVASCLMWSGVVPQHPPMIFAGQRAACWQ